MPSTKRAALYHRVSTVDQDAAAARKELRAAAKRLGYRVVLNVEETGSGALNNRPGLTRILHAAHRGTIDAVIVWKLDRFGRSALDLLASLRELDGAGVRFHAVTQGLDLRPGADAMSRLMLTMLSAIAEFERELISERTRLGLAKARAAGKHIGRPRGPRPTKASVQRLRKRGYSWRELADELGCSVWVARDTFREAIAEKGAQKAPSKRPRRGASKRV